MEAKQVEIIKTYESNKDATRFSIFSYYKQYLFFIIVYICLLAISAGLTIAVTILEADIIEFVSTSIGSKNFFYTAVHKLLIILSIYIAEIIIEFIRIMLYDILRIKITTKMRIDISLQVFKLSSKTYADHNTNNIISRINNDPADIFSYISGATNLIKSTITAFIIICYIAYLNIYLGITLLIIVILASLSETYRRRQAKKKDKSIRKKSEYFSSLLVEIVKSEKDIKSLNLEENLKTDLERRNDNTVRNKQKREIFDNIIRSISQIFLQVGSIVSLIIGIGLYNKELITLSSFVLVYSYRNYTSKLVRNFSEFYDYILKVKLASERINELYQDDEYELEHYGTKHIDSVKGLIEFKNVSFSYVEYEYLTDKQKKDALKKAKLEQKRQKQLKRKQLNSTLYNQEKVDNLSLKATNESDNAKHKIAIPTKRIISKTKVFDNLSFVIEPNTTVAFVGKSGSGKSTILNLISKIYSVDSGKVTIDHVNVLDLDKDTLRSSITFVNQFPYIFDMSIRENLLLANKDASDEEIAQVLKDSALEEFVASLPSGIETRVGESGIKLSGGQRQRLAIARALLRKSAIILFDESTSSLDNIAQNKVKESIDNIKGKGTVVIVAHRLSTIKNVDKIFFLNDGEIVDTGTFDELYKRNKTFKKMFLAEDID